MKTIVYILSALFLISCGSEEPANNGFDTKISTFNVSHKLDTTTVTYYDGKGKHIPTKKDDFTIWIQSPISTESFSVDSSTFKLYNVGDTMDVLIHNTEKVTSSGVPHDTFSAFTKKYVISHKQSYSHRYGSSYTIWFKTNTETKSCDVDYQTFNKLDVGDTIVVLYKTKRHYVPDNGVIF